MARKQQKIRVVELFAGVGGFRIGFEKANKNRFDTVWFNQWEPGKKQQHAHDVYAKKWPKGEMLYTDTNIEEVVINHIKHVPDHDLLVGGFPCQDYSVARPLNQSQGLIGKKGVLWWSIVSIVKQLEDMPKREAPKLLLLENVDRLLKSPGNQRGRDFAIMLQSLQTLGYNVEWRVVNAADYGFPQRRRRVFILAYKKDTGLANASSKAGHVNWFNKGVLGTALPIEAVKESDFFEEITLDKNENEISDSFGIGDKTSRFQNAGIMIDGKIFTTKSQPKPLRSFKTIGNFVLSDEEVIKEYGEHYFIDDEEVLAKWRKQKGPKKIERINKFTNEPYLFSEGGMAFPDSLDKPARTIVTGEGGSGPSRFKHVIESPQSGRFRRLTPVELEQLSMFPKNHTANGINGPISDNTRAFFIGNALVTGVITKIGKQLLDSVDEHGL